MNFVMTLSDTQIAAMKMYYKEALVKNPKGPISAQIKLKELVITIYHTGTVMFQGKQAEEAFFFWHESFDITPATFKSEPNRIHEFYMHSIGSDESGVGDYFGPLTVCAAYVSDEHVAFLKTLNIKDSKLLSDQYIEKIGVKLSQNIPYSLLVLDNKKYNDMIIKGYNANKLKAYLHAQCHKNLIKKIGHRPMVIVDQFSEEATYMRYLKHFDDAVKPDLLLPKAESHYASVAVASIIARYAFIQHLKTLSQDVGMELHKGASKKVDEQVAYIIKHHGERILNQIAKVHFTTTQKGKDLIK